jgi:Holliday junction resolvasome RuvABC endonuclease subunit
MSRNSQAHSIGELGGVVRVALYERRIPFIEIPPTCRAKFATGKGNAGKSEVVSAVSAMTGIVWSGGDGDDRCDAWILEQMLIAKLGLSEYAWSAQQLSALEKVDWTGLS